MEFWLQFKFWANFAKLQTEWIGLAIVFGQGGCSAAGAEPLRPAPPRAWPRSCLLLCLARTSSSASSIAWIKPRVAGVFPFSSWYLTADSHHSPPKFTSPASFPIHPSTPLASPSSQQSIAPLSASANPSLPATELFPLQLRPKRRRRHSTVASVTPSPSTAALCLAEVAVSPCSLCTGWFALYSLVMAGVCSAEAAVRRARGHGG